MKLSCEWFGGALTKKGFLYLLQPALDGCRAPQSPVLVGQQAQVLLSGAM